MAGKRFLGLDGLRGVCALTVLLFHADGLFHKGPIFMHGFLAVDMFFLLSGFVIAYVHEEKLNAGAGLARFLRLRAARLLPVYWLGAALNIAIFLWMASAGYYPGYGWAVVWILVPVTTLLMLPAFGAPGNGFAPAMMNVTWSLYVEWVVNIVYAAIAYRMRTRTLAALVIGGWLVMGIAGYFTGTGWCVGMSRYQFLSFGLLRGFSSFLAGVVLCRLRDHRLFTRLPALAPELVLTCWLCIAAMPTFAATPTFDWITVALLCPALMMLLLRSDARTPGFCKMLGRLSYPLYVVHPGFILMAQMTPLFGLNKGPDPLRAGLVVLVCVGAAWMIALLTDALPRSLKFERKSLAVAQP